MVPWGYLKTLSADRRPRAVFPSLPSTEFSPYGARLGAMTQAAINVDLVLADKAFSFEFDSAKLG